MDLLPELLMLDGQTLIPCLEGVGDKGWVGGDSPALGRGPGGQEEQLRLLYSTLAPNNSSFPILSGLLVHLVLYCHPTSEML